MLYDRFDEYYLLDYNRFKRYLPYATAMEMVKAITKYFILSCTMNLLQQQKI